MSNKNKRYTSCDEISPVATKMLRENDRVLHEHNIIETYKNTIANAIDCSDSHRF